MDEMIKKIIQMDQEARKLTQAAVEQKITAERNIDAQREKIREEYINIASDKLKEYEEKHRKRVEEHFNAKCKDYDAAMNKLIKSDEQNHKKWVSEIISRSLA